MTDKNLNLNMHYQTHVFCCVNERAPEHPRSCCAARGSIELRTYMKSQSKALGIKNIRVNNAGCLERCELGPTMVIYPEGVWYHYNTKEDIDEILENHIINGKRVDRLLLKPGQTFLTPTTNQLIELSVTNVRNETSNIKAVELKSAEGNKLPEFTAGAHIDLIINDGIRRSYSIANDPADHTRYLLGILCEKDSRGGSSWIYEHVSPGTQLKAVAPVNNFALSKDATEHIFIAGGIGITPILAMGYELAQSNTQVSLHYCTRSLEETAFTKDVRKVFGDNAYFHHDGGDFSKGVDLHSVLRNYPDGAHLYLCGPRGLMDAAEAAAKSWPKECIHREYFSGQPKKDSWVNEEFEISLSRHKKTLTVPTDKSILDIVREAGVSADASCQEGYCTTCRTNLLYGQPEHRDSVLTAEEKAENKTIMICVSRAKAGEHLVLDL